MIAWGFDTETTGLRLYQEDRPFLYCLSNETQPDGYVFKPKPEPALFGHRGITWFLMNAPFDMAALAVGTGEELAGDVHDIQVLARLENNTHMKYRLEDIAAREGLFKDETVEKYIKEHKLYTMKKVPGKKKRVRFPHFDMVPDEIMHPYARKDASITRSLGLTLLGKIQKMDEQLLPHHRPLMEVVELESKVTKVVYDMIRTGIRLDKAYVEAAAAHYTTVIEKAEDQWKVMTGNQFVDSFKALSAAFTPLGFAGGVTEKGQPSYTDKILAKIPHPMARLVETHRDATKRNSTFFLSFLEFLGSDGKIHPNFRQAGTRTGRMSCAGPNLQQLSADEEDENDLSDDEIFQVRKAFIPEPGSVLVSIDYKQQEYWLLADMAGEMGLIEQIAAGVDVHDATAKMLGVSRKKAKTLNFGILYGMGVKKLAAALGVKVAEAYDLRDLYFSKLPRIKAFVRMCTQTAEKRKWVKAWSGRVFKFDDPRFAYKACNAVIQGGSADITKRAMVACHEFLKDKKSKLILAIHDELIFNVTKDELWIIPTLKRLMIEAYPYRHLPMGCSVAIGENNLHDLVDYEC